MKGEQPYKHSPRKAAGDVVVGAIIAEGKLPSDDAETIASLVADANWLRERENKPQTVTAEHVLNAMSELAGMAAVVESFSRQK